MFIIAAAPNHAPSHGDPEESFRPISFDRFDFIFGRVAVLIPQLHRGWRACAIRGCSVFRQIDHLFFNEDRVAVSDLCGELARYGFFQGIDRVPWTKIYFWRFRSHQNHIAPSCGHGGFLYRLFVWRPINIRSVGLIYNFIVINLGYAVCFAQHGKIIIMEPCPNFIFGIFR